MRVSLRTWCCVRLRAAHTKRFVCVHVCMGVSVRSCCCARTRSLANMFLLLATADSRPFVHSFLLYPFASSHQRLYDSKQFKKALKAADQILKRFPNHGGATTMTAMPIGVRQSARRSALASRRVLLLLQVPAYACAAAALLLTGSLTAACPLPVWSSILDAETLSMKALVVHSGWEERKAEAYSLAKQVSE
eukprot:GHVU01074632.1.p1 GENE.GHVU01074632.1~~GHVU01074632.1.p1  ORF type:complete len:192 (+),score=14.05 GHVU01074632.1:3998-4573(+)